MYFLQRLFRSIYVVFLQSFRLCVEWLVWPLCLAAIALLPAGPLYSESVSRVDFFQLESYVRETHSLPQKIQIRGFLYSKDSAYILAAEPDLRSCCVGSAAKRHAQVLILGNIETALNRSTPILLEGTFSHHPDHPFPYHLESAQVVPEEPPSYAPVVLISVILLLISIWILTRLRR